MGDEMTSIDPQDHPGLPVPPPLLPLLALLAAIALDWLTGLSFLPAIGPEAWTRWVGLALCAAAIILAVAGFRTFTAAGTNVDPRHPATRLVTHGPYRFTRNPMYVGQILFYLGLCLVFSLEWGLILTPILWLVFDRMIVAREERYLANKFGDPYRTFLERTRRWI